MISSADRARLADVIDPWQPFGLPWEDMMTEHLRKPHDLGGLADGPVERGEHAHEPWEKRVDSIMRLVSDKKRKILTVDELRRGIEDLGPGAYEEFSYYERWISSLSNVLIEKGVVSVDELGRKMAEIEARWNADREAQP